MCCPFYWKSRQYVSCTTVSVSRDLRFEVHNQLICSGLPGLCCRCCACQAFCSRPGHVRFAMRTEADLQCLQYTEGVSDAYFIWQFHVFFRQWNDFSLLLLTFSTHAQKFKEHRHHPPNSLDVVTPVFTASTCREIPSLTGSSTGENWDENNLGQQDFGHPEASVSKFKHVHLHIVLKILYTFVSLTRCTAYQFDRSSHREEMEGMGDIGGFRDADGKSRLPFWMKYRGLNRVPGRARKEL